MTKKIKFTKEQLTIIQNRIIDYVSKQLGMARYLHSIKSNNIVISINARALFDFFIQNPFEIVNDIDDIVTITKIEQEDHAMCLIIQKDYALYIAMLKLIEQRGNEYCEELKNSRIDTTI